jgi:hypothetical protein
MTLVAKVRLFMAFLLAMGTLGVLYMLGIVK